MNDMAVGAQVSGLLGKHACLHVYAVVARGVLGLPPNVPVLEGVVCLAWGLNLTVPIRDLRVTGGCLSGTLSFNGRARFVSIPWRAIVGVRDGVTGATLAAYPHTYGELQGCAPEAPRAPASASEAPNVVRVDFRAKRRVLS